jgi:hypothetical protein
MDHSAWENKRISARRGRLKEMRLMKRGTIPFKKVFLLNILIGDGYSPFPSEYTLHKSIGLL